MQKKRLEVLSELAAQHQQAKKAKETTDRVRRCLYAVSVIRFGILYHLSWLVPFCATEKTFELGVGRGAEDVGRAERIGEEACSES